MSSDQAKLRLKYGELQIEYEGEQAFLRDGFVEMLQQAGEVLGRLPNAPIVHQPAPLGLPEPPPINAQFEAVFSTSLHAHLKAKGADKKQVEKFLATADWLRRRGSNELNTAAVSKALAENQQSKLSNPADCLNQNVAKGFCEKTASGFFITPEGISHLGGE